MKTVYSLKKVFYQLLQIIFAYPEFLPIVYKKTIFLTQQSSFLDQ